MRNGGLIGKAPAGYGRFDLPDQHVRQVAEAWPPDPYWSNVVLLTHCDGLDNATQTRAVKGNGPAFMFNARLEDSVKKFGSSSMYFDGTNDRVQLASGDFAFGTEDFTIEFWINPTNGGHGNAWSRVMQFGPNTSAGGLWIVCTNTENPTHLLCQTYGTGYSDVASSTNTLSNGAWTHVALSRQSTTYYFFFNGALESNYNNATGNNITATDLYMGSNNGNAEAYLGYLDEIRITRGVARYTSAFTAPTLPFPNG